MTCIFHPQEDISKTKRTSAKAKNASVSRLLMHFHKHALYTIDRMNCREHTFRPTNQAKSKPTIFHPAQPAHELRDNNNTPTFTISTSYSHFMKIPKLFGANSKKDDGIDESIKGEAASYVIYALAKHQLTEENNPQEALALYNRALIIQREALGKDHIMVARTLHDIGLCLTALDQSFPALTALEEALWIRQQQLGPGDPAVAETTTALWKLLSHERHRIEGDDKANGEDDVARKGKSTTNNSQGRAATSHDDKGTPSKGSYEPAMKKPYEPIMAPAQQQAAASKYSHTRSKQTKPNSANARSA